MIISELKLIQPVSFPFFGGLRWKFHGCI